MIRAIWSRIHEPRVVAVLLFTQYTILAAAGTYALVEPPNSIEGEIGSLAMYMLAALLTLGGLIGSVAVLPGIYWLERFAVGSVFWAALIYLVIILVLHVQAPVGNRLLQAGIVAYVVLQQPIRWTRIRERPYRPEDPTVAQA